MGIIRDMRKRIERLEQRDVDTTYGSAWADAAPYIAFWAFLAVFAMARLMLASTNRLRQC